MVARKRNKKVELNENSRKMVLYAEICMRLDEQVTMGGKKKTERLELEYQNSAKGETKRGGSGDKIIKEEKRRPSKKSYITSHFSINCR